MGWIRRETEKGTTQYICPNCHDYHEFREDFGEQTFNENFVFCRRCGARNGTGTSAHPHPAADVAEVRHGRWEFLGPNRLIKSCMCGTCSVCHVRSVYIVNTAICPNCGAPMDKEDKHEVKCAKCGKIKEIICTVDGKPWCEDCLDRAMGWPLHLTKSSEVQNERNPFQS